MTHRTHSNELALTVLNDAFQRDPAAIHALICNSVPCNAAMAESPHVYVEHRTVVAAHAINALTLVNSILLAYDIPLVELQFETRGGTLRFAGFIPLPPQPDDVLIEEAVAANGEVDPATLPRLDINFYTLPKDDREYLEVCYSIDPGDNEFIVGGLRSAYEKAIAEGTQAEFLKEHTESDLQEDDWLTEIFQRCGAVVGQTVNIRNNG